MKEIKIYSPATIANISCGFDVLGMALNKPLDKIIMRKSLYPGVRICKIKGANLSKIPNKNIVGVVLNKMLNRLPNNKFGIEVDLYKNIKPGSGIGSSAASAAGAAVGANALLGNPFKPIEIIGFALEGEKLASGKDLHADNVSPAIMGGVTLVRSNNPLEIVSLPCPENLWVSILHPQIEILTSESRKMLGPKITLKNAIKHWGNIGAFVSAVYRQDYPLLGRTIEDFVAEPIRHINIPYFYEVKSKCLNAGALGGGISGSGPSIFMLCENKEIAERVAKCMCSTYNKWNGRYIVYITTVNSNGVQFSFS